MANILTRLLDSARVHVKNGIGLVRALRPQIVFALTILARSEGNASGANLLLHL